MLKLLRYFTVIALLFFALPVKAASGDHKPADTRQKFTSVTQDSSPAILGAETHLFSQANSIKLPAFSPSVLFISGWLCQVQQLTANLKSHTRSSAIVPVTPQLLYPFHGFW